MNQESTDRSRSFEKQGEVGRVVVGLGGAEEGRVRAILKESEREQC